jgi:broad specificity phosphatase PhoE
MSVRWLEVRRHSLTKKGPGRGRGSHLSAEGVGLARRIGGQTGPFDVVVTSTVARTIETALAMGFAVDDTLDMGGGVWESAQAQVGDHQHWEWANPFVDYAELIASGGPVAALADRQRVLWSSVVDRTDSGERALVISHGGLIEPGLVASVAGADYAEWGRPFGHCEGVRLAYDGGAFDLMELLRLPA